MTRARPLLIAAVAWTLLPSACGTAEPSDASPAGYTPQPPPATEPSATSEPSVSPPGRQEPPRSRVPRELTGTWSGGSRNDSTGGKTYRFTSDGMATFSFEGAELTGTVVVEETTMTLYLGSQVLTMDWRYVDCDDPAGYGFPFKSLALDGLSYVQDC